MNSNALYLPYAQAVERKPSWLDRICVPCTCIWAAAPLFWVGLLAWWLL